MKRGVVSLLQGLFHSFLVTQGGTAFALGLWSVGLGLTCARSFGPRGPSASPEWNSRSCRLSSQFSKAAIAASKPFAASRAAQVSPLRQRPVRVCCCVWIRVHSRSFVVRFEPSPRRLLRIDFEQRVNFSADFIAHANQRRPRPFESFTGELARGVEAQLRAHADFAGGVVGGAHRVPRAVSGVTPATSFSPYEGFGATPKPTRQRRVLPISICGTSHQSSFGYSRPF
jgi:hypothetical protein